MKSNFATKCFALLAVLMLSGCGVQDTMPAAPAATEETAATPAAEAMPQGRLHFVWQGGSRPSVDGKTVYGVDSGYYYDARFLTGLDLDTGVLELVCAKSGCSQRDARCDAWLGPSPADGYTIAQCGAFADGGKLYRVYVTAPEHGGGAARSTLTVSALDGSGQKTLCEGFAPDGSCLDIAWLADDGYLYAVYESNPPRSDGLSSERTVVLSIAKADGSVRILFDWAAGGEMPTTTPRIFAAAVCSGRLVLSRDHPPEEHTGSMADDAAATRITFHILDLDTGTLSQPLPVEDTSDFFSLQGEEAWQIDDAGNLTVTDPLTGETLQEYPGLWPETWEPQTIFAVTDQAFAIDGRECTPAPDGSLSCQIHRLVFDRATGSLLRELPATWMKDGAVPQLPTLYAAGGGRAILQVGSRTGTAIDMGQDGTVYTHPAETPVYAVIGLEEYLSGSQDWTTCTPADLYAVRSAP